MSEEKLEPVHVRDGRPWDGGCNACTPTAAGNMPIRGKVRVFQIGSTIVRLCAQHWAEVKRQAGR